MCLLLLLLFLFLLLLFLLLLLLLLLLSFFSFSWSSSWKSCVRCYFGVGTDLQHQSNTKPRERVSKRRQTARTTDLDGSEAWARADGVQMPLISHTLQTFQGSAVQSPEALACRPQEGQTVIGAFVKAIMYCRSCFFSSSFRRMRQLG